MKIIVISCRLFHYVLVSDCLFCISRFWLRCFVKDLWSPWWTWEEAWSVASLIHMGCRLPWSEGWPSDYKPCKYDIPRWSTSYHGILSHVDWPSVCVVAPVLVSCVRSSSQDRQSFTFSRQGLGYSVLFKYESGILTRAYIQYLGLFISPLYIFSLHAFFLITLWLRPHL